MDNIEHATRMSFKYYNTNTFQHVSRVTIFVDLNELIPENIKEDCIALSMMHDLIEDTEYQVNSNLGKHFIECLELLTKQKNENYTDYIKRIKDNAKTHPEAYWVKLADMKDHLSQTETLTDKLKEKYLKALPYLL